MLCKGGTGMCPAAYAQNLRTYSRYVRTFTLTETDIYNIHIYVAIPCLQSQAYSARKLSGKCWSVGSPAA